MSRFSQLEIDLNNDADIIAKAPTAKPESFTTIVTNDPQIAQIRADEAARQAREAETTARIRAARGVQSQRNAPAAAPVVSTPVTAPVESANVATVNALVVVDLPSEQTGEMVLWELSGSVTFEALTRAWVAQGLDLSWIPRAPRAETALTLACKDYQSKTCKVESVEEIPGWYLVDVKRTKALSYRVGSRFFLDAEGQVQVEGETHAYLLQQIRAKHAEYLVEISNTGAWLTGVVARLAGVALRSKGALYFVPRQHVQTLGKVKAALRAASSCHILGFAAMRSSDAVVGILEGIKGEVLALEKQVDDSAAKEVGARAVKSRLEDCDALEAKISDYEKLLGAQFPAPKASIAALRVKLAAYSTRFAQLEV